MQGAPQDSQAVACRIRCPQTHRKNRKSVCYTKGMIDRNILQSLTDDELLRRLSALLSQSRRVEADLVAHIGEVDERHLYAREACSSTFAYCTEVLHLSEAESFLRIAAARASRKYPRLLAMLDDGRMHLSGVGKLAPHLTDANCDDVLTRAAHKSKREIEELVAALAPKPDVPSTVRKLPRRVDPAPSVQLRPDAVKNETTPLSAPPTPPPVVQPLAPERYRVQFTASNELREKLDRLQSVMQEDLAAVIEAAVTEKLERLEAKRYAKRSDRERTSRMRIRRRSRATSRLPYGEPCISGTAIDAHSSMGAVGAAPRGEDSSSTTTSPLPEEAHTTRRHSAFTVGPTTFTRPSGTMEKR
jgi:hypothetical protein